MDCQKMESIRVLQATSSLKGLATYIHPFSRNPAYVPFYSYDAADKAFVAKYQKNMR